MSGHGPNSSPSKGSTARAKQSGDRADRHLAVSRAARTSRSPLRAVGARTPISPQALHGSHGDLCESVYAMALMFALDRREARSSIAAAAADCDIVVCDRYVASNAGLQRRMGRLLQDAGGEVVSWVDTLEFGRSACRPRPARAAGRHPGGVAMSRHGTGGVRRGSDARRIRTRRQSAAPRRRRLSPTGAIELAFPVDSHRRFRPSRTRRRTAPEPQTPPSDGRGVCITERLPFRQLTTQ